MTKREMFNLIASVNADNAEIVTFCNNEISALDHRKASKTPTKVQKENVVVMEKIVEALADIAAPCTVSELLKHGIEGFEPSNQKASALLRKLVEEKRVVKTIEGKKSLFSVA